MDVPSHVDDAAYRRLHARYGPSVGRWWSTVPALMVELSERWDLTLGSPVGRGNTSLVVRCRRADGLAAILKLCPQVDIAVAEATALRRWKDTCWVPALWEQDAAIGALLLEAISSETPLSEGAEPISLASIAELVDGLHGSGEPSLGQGVVDLSERVDFIFEHWMSRYRRCVAVTDVVPIKRLQAGWELAQRLVSSATGSVLLHGDLHPANVLNGGRPRGLVAIDPRACVGDPAFDLVDWVFWNAKPAEWEARSHDLAKATGVGHDGLWAWCSAFAGLLAASRLTRGGSTEAIEALLGLAP